MSSGSNSTAALRRFLWSLLWIACEPNTLERTHAVFSLQPCSIFTCIPLSSFHMALEHWRLKQSGLWTSRNQKYLFAGVATGFEQVLAENERKLSRKLRILVLYTVKELCYDYTARSERANESAAACAAGAFHFPSRSGTGRIDAGAAKYRRRLFYCQNTR